MIPCHSFTAIDSHTAGATTRIVTSGVPRLSGDSMLERMEDFADNHDHIRRTLMLEPRGNANMSGAFLTEPITAGADLGVIFTHSQGYHLMCGHGALGVACAAVETGLVAFEEPRTSIVLDTPAGPIAINVDTHGGNVVQATFRNVPAFVFQRDMLVSVNGGRTVSVNVAFGGVPVILAEAQDMGLDIKEGVSEEAIEIALSVIEQVAGEPVLKHPESQLPMSAGMVLISDAPISSAANSKGLIVTSAGGVDRSPCGAATCARMAQLYFQNKLELGAEFVHEGILGTRFSGRLVERKQTGSYESVVPEVSARAHIVGFNKWVIDGDDPLRDGFLF